MRFRFGKSTVEHLHVVVIRPSGTEPKIKFYYMVGGKTEEETKEKLKKLKTLPAAITKAQVQ